MSAPDPFAAPQTTDTVVETRARTHYGAATQGQRFLNLLLDFVGCVVWSIMLGLVLGVVAPDVLLDEESIFMKTFGWTAMLSYYILLESFTGRTLGKLITGTRVVRRDDGGRPRLLQVIGRSFARFVPFEAFSCLDTPPDGWHDRWSGTRVVRLRPSKMDLLLAES